ncbi:MAG: hypothetical protein F6K55_28420 [Moorea sp. SIO4A3]|nr:hypothetical protein [Moorena sp. SIO4A3]
MTSEFVMIKLSLISYHLSAISHQLSAYGLRARYTEQLKAKGYATRTAFK